MKKMLLAAIAVVGLAGAAQAADSTVAALPGHAKMMRPAQIEQALREQGYPQVRKVSYWNGVYTAAVLKPGRGWVTLTLDPVSGQSLHLN